MYSSLLVSERMLKILNSQPDMMRALRDTGVLSPKEGELMYLKYDRVLESDFKSQHLVIEFKVQGIYRFTVFVSELGSIYAPLADSSYRSEVISVFRVDKDRQLAEDLFKEYGRGQRVVSNGIFTYKVQIENVLAKLVGGVEKSVSIVSKARRWHRIAEFVVKLVPRLYIKIVR